MRFYRRLSEIRLLSFDLDDTLYDNKPVIRRAEAWLQQYLQQHFPAMGAVTPLRWQALKTQLLAEQPALIHDVTRTRILMLTLLLRRAGYPTPEQEAEQIFARFFHVRSDFVVPQTSHDVLSRLASRYPMIAITNGNVDVERIGLSPYFQHIFKAGEGRRMKPWPDLFQLAKEVTRVPAGQILHIGDHLETDITGAVTNGFRAAWFNQANHQPACRHHARLRHLPDLEFSHLTQLIQLI